MIDKIDKIEAKSNITVQIRQYEPFSHTFSYGDLSTAQEKIDRISMRLHVLHDEHTLHIEACVKNGCNIEDFDKIRKEDKCDILYFRIKRIDELNSTICDLEYEIIEILRELPDEDPEKLRLAKECDEFGTYLTVSRIAHLGVEKDDHLILKEYSEYHAAKGCILKESNIKNWLAFACQLPLWDLISNIRSIKKYLSIDDEPSNRLEGWHYAISGAYKYYHDTIIERVVDCCFVESFSHAPSKDEWIRPVDIITAVNEHHCWVFWERLEVQNRIQELLQLGHIERHPDDKNDTEEARYRVRY